jgi:hypothetical protein
MKTKELNEKDKTFIRENRLEMSMMTMSEVLEKPFYHVRKFMINEDLLLTDEQIRSIRTKNLKKTNTNKSIPLEPLVKKTPIRDFWNSNLNTITMYRNG